MVCIVTNPYPIVVKTELKIGLFCSLHQLLKTIRLVIVRREGNQLWLPYLEPILNICHLIRVRSLSTV